MAALTALKAAGLAEPVADPLARRAPALCLFAIQFREAENMARAKRNAEPLGLGFLRDVIANPDKHNIAEAAGPNRDGSAGRWQPPKGSPMARNLRKEEAAERARQRKYREAEAKILQHQRDAELAAAPDPNEAAWAALPEADRRGIEAGVKREHPGISTDGPRAFVFRWQCHQRMRQLLAAQAEADQWNALPEAERQAIERDARAIFQLWADTPDGLRNACLTLMVSRARKDVSRSPAPASPGTAPRSDDPPAPPPGDRRPGWYLPGRS